MYNSDQTKYLWCDYNDTEDYQAFRNINFISLYKRIPFTRKYWQEWKQLSRLRNSIHLELAQFFKLRI